MSAFAPHASAVTLDTFITDWSLSEYSPGTEGSVTGNLSVGGGNVQVTFTGDVRDLQEGHTSVFNHIGHLSGQTFFTPNLPVSDAIGTWGTPASLINTITFSSPVENPIIWIASLGRGGDWEPVDYVQTWTFDAPFTLLSSLNVPWGGGTFEFPEANPYQMTTFGGNQLIGQEGHGSIQFSGSFSSISWTSNLEEQSAYFQVGYQAAAIPEPSTYAALFGALALAGTIYWKRNRRVTAVTTA